MLTLIKVSLIPMVTIITTVTMVIKVTMFTLFYNYYRFSCLLRLRERGESEYFEEFSDLVCKKKSINPSLNMSSDIIEQISKLQDN